jgi:hypothetical protein
MEPGLNWNLWRTWSENHCTVAVRILVIFNNECKAKTEFNRRWCDFYVCVTVWGLPNGMPGFQKSQLRNGDGYDDVGTKLSQIYAELQMVPTVKCFVHENFSAYVYKGCSNWGMKYCKQHPHGHFCSWTTGARNRGILFGTPSMSGEVHSSELWKIIKPSVD